MWKIKKEIEKQEMKKNYSGLKGKVEGKNYFHFFLKRKFITFPLY